VFKPFLLIVNGRIVPPVERQRRGRPKKYGGKIKIKELFKDPALFVSVPSPVYGERGVDIKYRTIDLYWRPVGRLVKFVCVIHPTRGCMTFLSTDLSIDAVEVVRCYGVRFKIEATFKQAVHTVGSWLRTIRPGIAPSEGVVILALRQCLPEFLATNRENNILAKFITDNLDLDRAEGWHLAS
jgi:hypothetical protein